MRGRGGGNNNRKGPNPLTRSYESNGPDVKIRGTAQQVADKYAALARDAQSSGDRVMAENYLQHAEHYNRIIAAAQAQLQPQQNQRDQREDGDDDNQEARSSDDAEPQQEKRQRREQTVDHGSAPQPVIDGTPAEVALKNQPSESSKSGEDTGEGEGKPAKPARRTRRKPAEASDAGETTEASDSEAAVEASEDKPKRTRRPRTKKADSSTDSDEGAAGPAEAAEPVAAIQG